VNTPGGFVLLAAVVLEDKEANNHFKLDPQIIDWLKANRPVNGAQGDEYVTLNKGDLSPLPAK
jgi:hypothetical protein